MPSKKLKKFNSMSTQWSDKMTGAICSDDGFVAVCAGNRDFSGAEHN